MIGHPGETRPTDRICGNLVGRQPEPDRGQFRDLRRVPRAVQALVTVARPRLAVGAGRSPAPDRRSPGRGACRYLESRGTDSHRRPGWMPDRAGLGLDLDRLRPDSPRGFRRESGSRCSGRTINGSTTRAAADGGRSVPDTRTSGGAGPDPPANRALVRSTGRARHPPLRPCRFRLRNRSSSRLWRRAIGERGTAMGVDLGLVFRLSAVEFPQCAVARRDPGGLARSSLSINPAMPARCTFYRRWLPEIGSLAAVVERQHIAGRPPERRQPGGIFPGASLGAASLERAEARYAGRVKNLSS